MSDGFCRCSSQARVHEPQAATWVQHDAQGLVHWLLKSQRPPGLQQTPLHATPPFWQHM